MSLGSSICRWIGLLTGISQKARPPANLGRLALPTEIIYLIGSHLDEPSLLCLALTCQSLYSVCHPSCPELSRPQREKFLLLLEKTTPHLYFCYACTALHRWHSSWFRCLRRYLRGTSRPPCQRGHELELYLPHFTSRVPYHLARVVMNAHFYGDAHGVPVDMLSCPLESFTYGDGTKISCSWRCRIIDDNLLICIDYTASHTRGDARILRRFFKDHGPYICHHLPTTSDPWRRATEDDSTWYESRCVVPELARNSTRPDYFAHCTASVKSCAHCMTDYCIDIAHKGGGWVVNLNVYQQLGRARSPQDWDWDVMMYNPSKRDPQRLQSGHPPGMVRHRWSQVDAIMLAPEGEFLERQRYGYRNQI